MAERDLTLKLGTQLKSGGDDALRHIGRSALDAKQQTDTLFRSTNAALEAMKSQAQAAGETLKRTFASGSAELDKLNAKIGRFDKQFRGVAKAGLGGSLVGVGANRLDVRRDPAKAGGIASGGTALGEGIAGLFGLSATLTGPLAAATAALTAFSAAVKTAEYSTKLYYGSLEFNRASGKAESNPVTRRRMEQEENRKAGPMWRLGEKLLLGWTGKPTELGEGAYREGGPDTDQAYEEYLDTKFRKVPQWALKLRGWMWGKQSTVPMTRRQFSEHQKSGYQAAFETFQAHQERLFAPQEAAAQFGKDREINTLKMEQERVEAEARLAVGMRATGQRLTIESGAMRRQAIGAAAKNPLYGREQQIEDINRQIGVRQAYLRATAQGKFQQQGIAAQLRENQAQTGDYRQRYEAAMKEEKAAREKIADAEKENVGGQEVLRLSELALAVAEKRKAAEEALIASQRQGMALRREGEQAILHTQEQQREILRGNLETTQHQIEAEKRREQGLKEHLGLLHPQAIRTAVGVLRKYKGGQQLTMGEIGFMQQHTDLFGKQLEQIGRQRATQGPMAGMIQELMQGTNQGARRQVLEKQELAIKQQITIAAKLDVGNLSQTLHQALAKPIEEMMKQLKIQLTNEINRLKLERSAQQRALFPDMPH
ncbi:MAG TPA: hypothetical protein VMG10_31000 [Gemmataceae bacterium]|nr:hypothetical protein [Gemmataceae bacterium]